MIRKVVVQYDVEEGVRFGGGLHGQPAKVGLLLVGFLASVWGT